MRNCCMASPQVWTVGSSSSSSTCNALPIQKREGRVRERGERERGGKNLCVCVKIMAIRMRPHNPHKHRLFFLFPKFERLSNHYF